MAAAQPTIGPQLSVLDRTLVGEQSSPWATPRGTAEEMASPWDEWGGTLELLRVLFDVPESWSTTFESGFRRALAPRERLALPGTAQRTRWTGGAAAASTVGSIEWGLALKGAAAQAPIFAAVEAGPLLRQLEDVLACPGAEEDWIIAIVELLSFVALAAARGEAWRGELVYYVTDNMNVKAWLFERRPKHPFARRVIRLV